MTEDEREQYLNDIKVANFYRDLEVILKRHNPVEYILFMAARLRVTASNEKKWLHTPSFRILHSIEACCAYARGHSRDEVTLDRLFRVMNVYHNFTSPFLLKAIKSGNSRFILQFYREQGELQYVHSWTDFGRALLLYGEADSQISNEFNRRYKITPFQWIQLCFLIAAMAEKDSRGVVRIADLIINIRNLDLESTISEEAIRNFLSMSTITPSQIGNRFTELRKTIRPYFHACIRSVFLEFPLIAIDHVSKENNAIVLMQKDLLFRHSIEGPYRNIKCIDDYHEHLSNDFEHYVEAVIESYINKNAVITNRTLEKIARGKSCDFIVELAEAIILVECKATGFVAQLLTDNAIRQDTSTRRIAEGVRQLYATAFDLGLGIFDHLVSHEGKPLLGIVVTLGEIPYANIDDYYNEFISPLVESKIPEEHYPSERLTRRPISISIRTFEQLVSLCNSLPTNPIRLFDEKASLPEAQTGDWSQYIPTLLKKNRAKIESLPLVLEQEKRLMRSFRLPPEDIDKLIADRIATSNSNSE